MQMGDRCKNMISHYHPSTTLRVTLCGRCGFFGYVIMTGVEAWRTMTQEVGRVSSPLAADEKPDICWVTIKYAKAFT